ncbi:MAG TPA: hypothetical protein VMJ10_26510 [Kofleriaceae bacterium]|nr:hypothetical protein [Kofleriaceae bacterium]
MADGGARAIVAAGVAGIIVYAFPGYLSTDSIDQLAQARAGEYGDWHPPVMAALWHGVEIVVTGPLGMLVLQVTCFVVGAYLLLARVLAPRTAALVAVAIAWLPPIACELAVIWKDSQMAGYALLGVAFVGDSRRGARAAGLVLLGLASAMRYNAAALTLPIVLLAYAPPVHGARRLAIATVMWVAITGGAAAANRLLADRHEHPWQQSVAMMDLAGIARWSHADDRELAAALEGTPLRDASQIRERAQARYRPHWMWSEIWDDGGLFRPARDDTELDAITRAWRELVVAYPRAYLHHRWRMTRELLQVPGTYASDSAYVWFTDVQDLAGSARRSKHDAAPSRVQQLLQPAALWLGDSVWFAPWWYAVLSLVMLVFARRDRTAFALLAGGVLCELTLCFAAPTPDARYSLWLFVATAVGGALVVARRVRPA